MGNTVRELAVSCKGAELVSGKRFSSSARGDDVEAWVNSQL